MLYRLLADLTVLLHFGFILFALFGGYLALKWRHLLWLHLPALVWGVLVEAAGWYCPLTPLEQALRKAAGEAGYVGGFIEHYLLPVLYPDGLTREVQYLLAAILLGVNLGAYVVLFRRRRKTKGQA